MTANPSPLPPPPRRTYTGSVLVDPGNDRPALHPDYGNPWPDPAADPHPWRTRFYHRRPGVDVALILWLTLAVALLLAPLFWLFRP